MPFISVDHFAGVSREQRRELQEQLAGVVIAAFGSPPGNVRVFTRAFDPDAVFTPGGEHAGTLPVIRAEFLPGRNYEQKKALIAGLAHRTAAVLQVPVEQIRVILYEKEKGDWARGPVPMAEL